MNKLAFYFFFLFFVNNILMFSQGIKKYSPEVSGFKIELCFLSSEEFTKLLLTDEWDSVSDEFSFNRFILREANVYRNKKNNEIIVSFDKNFSTRKALYFDKDSNLISIELGLKKNNYNVTFSQYAILFRNEEDFLYYLSELNLLYKGDGNFRDIIIIVYQNKSQVEYLLTHFNYKRKKNKYDKSVNYFFENGQVLSCNPDSKHQLLFSSIGDYKGFLKCLNE